MTTRVLGARVDLVDRDQLIEEIIERATGAGIGRICYVNAHTLNLAYRDPQFREMLNAADIVFCDGFGVRLACRFLGVGTPKRLTPPDWIDDLLLAASQQDVGVFLLGDELAVVEVAAARMSQRFPVLRVGFNHGFFDHWGDEAAAVIGLIAASEASLILVGMGQPLQENWVALNAERLPDGAYLSVGALFTWYSGADIRASRFWTDHGLEWLTRLVRSPIRLSGRYLIGLPLLAVRVVKQRVFGNG